MSYQTNMHGHIIDEVDKMDLDKLVERKVELRAKGTKEKDVVLRVEKGTLSALMGSGWANYNRNGESDPDTPAIKVYTTKGATLTMSLPKNNEYHPKSKIGMWISVYGKAPHEGQEIELIANARGYWTIRL